MKLRDFLVSNREIAQLIYGVLLMLLIPTLLAFNTVSIIGRYNDNIDVILQRQALTLSRTISSFIFERLEDQYFLNEQIDALKQGNKDLLEISLLSPGPDSFFFAASSDSRLEGTTSPSFFYQSAWSLSPGNALASDYIDLAIDDQNLFSTDNDERFWLVAMPLYDQNDEKKALLSLKISSETVNELTRSNRNASIQLLIVTIIITILFLAAAVHLWDYAFLYRKMKEVDQMKDEFISIASHELRTPITGIKGWSALMVDGSLGKLSDDVLKGANIIKDSSERLASLVEDLLNVSRIEQGRIEIDLRDYDPAPLISAVIEELRVQSDAKSLALNYLPHSDKLPSIMIDKEKFKQILINIIGNSIKYTEKGQVDVSTEEKDNGNLFEIRVKDTGIGMSAKARESLFQKFYRIKTEKTQKINGTGLGLWITKQLVELMKGRISVDSIENVGSQFTLQFKVKKTGEKDTTAKTA